MLWTMRQSAEVRCCRCHALFLPLRYNVRHRDRLVQTDRQLRFGRLHHLIQSDVIMGESPAVLCK